MYIFTHRVFCQRLFFRQSNQQVAALYSSTRHISQTRKTDVIQGGLVTPRGLHAPPYPNIRKPVGATVKISFSDSRHLII